MKRTISIKTLFVMCGCFVLMVTSGISIYVGKMFLYEIDALAAKNEFQRNAQGIAEISTKFLFVDRYLPNSQRESEIAQFEEDGIIAIYDERKNAVWKADESAVVVKYVQHGLDINSIKIGDFYAASIPVIIDAETSSLQQYAIEYFTDVTSQVKVNEIIGYAVVVKPHVSSLASGIRNRYLLVGSTIILSMILLLSIIIYQLIGRPLRKLKKEISSNNVGSIRRNYLESAVSTQEIKSLVSAYLDQHDSISAAKEELEEQVEQRTGELNTALVHKEEAEEFRSTLFMNLSHDLKTPLTANIGYLDVALEALCDHTLDRSKLRYALEGALARGKMLAEEVDMLLQYSISADDLSQIVFGTVNAKELIEDALEENNLSREAAGNTLEFTFTGNDRIRTADRLVRHVVNNLLSNANRYCKDGSIEVHCHVDQAFHLTVTDTGPGIPAEEREHIFEPHFRSAVNSVVGPKGAGMGLSMAKRWVDHLNGTITLMPASDKTVFHVEIPEQQH